MSSWKIVLVTVCGCFGAALIADKVNEALSNASREKTRRLADREEQLTERSRETTKQMQAQADKARFEAEKASMECACDNCVNFADKKEVAAAEREVG